MFSECSLEGYEPPGRKNPENGTELDNYVSTQQGPRDPKLSIKDLDGGKISRSSIMEDTLRMNTNETGEGFCIWKPMLNTTPPPPSEKT